MFTFYLLLLGIVDDFTPFFYMGVFFEGDSLIFSIFSLNSLLSSQLKDGYLIINDPILFFYGGEWFIGEISLVADMLNA